VGIDDPAAAWLAVVRAATGVNLEQVADTDAARAAACQGLGGTYYPADATQSTLTSWSAGQVHLATAPLHDEIAAQATQIGALRAAGADSAAQISALRSEVAALRLDLRTLKLSLPATIPSPSALARNGIALSLAGPAKRPVSVRALISAAKAKKLGLRSRVVGRRSVVLDADGNATFTLIPANAAAALEQATGSLVLAVDATSGDRHTVVSASLGG
jgi:hypothetical protein